MVAPWKAHLPALPLRHISSFICTCAVPCHLPLSCLLLLVWEMEELGLKCMYLQRCCGAEDGLCGFLELDKHKA